MTQPTIKLLIGGPNSGKSTWIRETLNPMCELADTPWPTLVSSNRARSTYAEINGIPYLDTFNEPHNEAVETQFFHTLDKALHRGKDIVVDHHCATARERHAILQHIHEVNPNYWTEGLYFPTTVAEALHRNKVRIQEPREQGEADRILPDEYIREAHAKIERPSENEGFGQLRTVPQHSFGHAPDRGKKSTTPTSAAL